MSIVPFGPDGMLMIYAVMVSLIAVIVSRRRPRLLRAALAILGAAIVMVIVQDLTLDATDLTRQMVRASFVVVPSVLLLGMSRVVWFARHAWVFVLVGPLTFVGCYAGLCGICVSTGLV